MFTGKSPLLLRATAVYHLKSAIQAKAEFIPEETIARTEPVFSKSPCFTASP